MLQSIRDNSQGIVAKVIVGLIVVTFALFGVESLVSLTGGSNAPATVNGVDVSERDLYQGVELQRRQLLAQMGENADPTQIDENMLRGVVLDSLIQQQVMLQSAQNQGLAFTDAMADQMVLATPEFQVEGQFNRNQYEATLRNVGLTPLMYREYLRKENLIAQERNALLLSSFVTKESLQQLVELERQTRDVAYFTLPADSADVSATDEEIAEYYEQNIAQYMTDEQVIVDYLLLDKANLASADGVTEEELDAQYQQLLAGYQGDELRRSAHILVEISDQQDAAAAQEKAQALLDRVNAGEDFAALAKEASDDFGSADQGGDLGFNGKDVFVGPFEDALFSLNEGQVSGLVETEFGYHIIKLLEVKTKEAPSFDEAKDQLRQELAAQKAEATYVTERDRLADLSFSSGDLEEPAAELQLEIQTSEAFGRAGSVDGIAANSRVSQAAFAAEVLSDGVNSDVIDLDNNRSVVIRVKEHLRPRQQELAEVKDLIAGQLAAEKRSDALQQAADDAVAKLLDGAELAVVAGDQQVIEKSDVARGDQQVDPAIAARLFAMPHPAEGQATYQVVDLFDGGKAVVVLKAVNAAADAEIEEAQLKAMAGFIANGRGQQLYQQQLNELTAKAEIERL